ncbi:MAG: hypothetical protein LBL90_12825 [Prevotellaceae bacterium]|jgi:hypothetical protein|nr:hypothetical protein [Prevotellaceae bacterium]
MKTAKDLKKKLSDLGVNYGSIARDDWDSFVSHIQRRKSSDEFSVFYTMQAFVVTPVQIKQALVKKENRRNCEYNFLYLADL